MSALRYLGCAAVLLALTGSAQAADSYAGRIGNKFGTGIVNVATGIGEIPRNIYVVSNQEGPAVGIPVGFFKGLFQSFGRMGVGVMDMTTFFIPTKPMLTPPMVWENFDKETSYNGRWELYNTQ